MDVRQKAIEVALSLTAGAYQTGLLSYFTHRDLFPSLMKVLPKLGPTTPSLADLEQYVQESDSSSRAFEPFVLLGLLANYNKFEFQNPYRLRLDDFVNEGTIQKIIRSIGSTCKATRDEYVAVQDDLPEGWNFTSTMTYFGLGSLTSTAKAAPPAPSPEAAKALFAAL